MAEKKIGEGLGIAGFTLSILGILLAGVNGILLSIISFVFCMIQQKKNPHKLAKVGLIISVIAFILNIVIIVVSLIYLAPILKQIGGL